MNRQHTPNQNDEPIGVIECDAEKGATSSIESRRGFFKKAALVALGLGTTSAIDAAITTERGNEERVEGENGSHNVVFCRHNAPVETDAMNDADFLVLEVSDIDYETLKVGNIDLQKIIEALPAYKPYAHVVLESAKQNKPIYFMDSSTKISDLTGLQESGARLLALSVAETALGMTALDFALRPEEQTATPAARALSKALLPKGPEDTSETDQVRRGILRSGLATLGAYLLAPAARFGFGISRAAWQKHPDKNAPSTYVERGLSQLNESIHPEFETPVFEGRNAIIAQKMESMARSIAPKISHKPRSCLLIGGAHHGILQELQNTEPERLKHLSSLIGIERMEGEKNILRVDASINAENAQKLDCTLTLEADPGIARYKE